MPQASAGQCDDEGGSVVDVTDHCAWDQDPSLPQHAGASMILEDFGFANIPSVHAPVPGLGGLVPYGEYMTII
jgi:hypothetical protein